MKLFCIFAAILAIGVSEDVEFGQSEIEDSEAAASMELLKTSQETLEPAASSYNYPPRPNPSWNPPPQNNYVPPQNTYNPPQNNYNPPQNNYNSPQNNYNPPQNTYNPPQNNYIPPQNNYNPPQNNYNPPQNNYIPPQNNYVPPQNNYNPPQNEYVPNKKPYPPTYAPTQGWHSSTTPIPVIKNELYYGENGSYKYEYQIGDGTHVGEEGYFTNPKSDDESLVKKGWYSYVGADGKTYTVTYWADHTGFHAYGDHLPTPPPIPPAIQASIEQNAKEEAAKAEADKYKPDPVYHPQRPEHTYYPQQQQNYNPHQNYPTQQTNPSYGK